ncbi:MAG: hypothetical protein GTO03_13095, partial [Planctomycetales bacterium]|nr:hypothetical protein [Planctomycetales bacterium]
MPRDIAQYILRDPRYRIAHGQQVAVEVHRDDDPHAAALCCQLVDFSRKGMQILADVPFETGEQITAVLRQPGTPFELQRDARVQWQRPTADQKFAVGCQFSEQVSWETMGEL